MGKPPSQVGEKHGCFSNVGKIFRIVVAPARLFGNDIGRV
jgi:hypothetical protein